MSYEVRVEANRSGLRFFLQWNFVPAGVTSPTLTGLQAHQCCSPTWSSHTSLCHT